MSAWRMPSRATELAAQAAEWLAALQSNESPDPLGPEGDAPMEACPGCSRRVPVFELVDARLVPEHVGDYACGSCRGRLRRAGIIGPAEWVSRYGAPEDLQAALGAQGGGQ